MREESSSKRVIGKRIEELRLDVCRGIWPFKNKGDLRSFFILLCNVCSGKSIHLTLSQLFYGQLTVFYMQLPDATSVSSIKSSCL